MPEPTILNAADIRRAYICPTWFRRHGEITREIDPLDTPQEITRNMLEWWLPDILDDSFAKDNLVGRIESLRDAIKAAWHMADPEHRGLLEDVWLREKNLFVGVAALAVASWRPLKPLNVIVPRKACISASFQKGFYDYRPCAVLQSTNREEASRFLITSTASDEAQIRADVALGCDAHVLLAFDGIRRLHIQEIVIGRRAEQWYENPLCRYWRHDNGSISITGLTPDGKQCRAPHWRKVPVFSPESTDPNEIETMWAHVEWLMSQPEFNAGEILPDPVVMEIGDHQQYQFVDALRVLEQGFAETPVRNYTACDNPLFFPHGCPLKKECWG